MDWDFNVVHVVRGEKAHNKELWPHLDDDTSPDNLVTKVQGVIQPWSNLYNATNEPFYNFYDRLKSHYKFDGYMRVAVDTEVLYMAKTQVEMFLQLDK
ncbi:hypothetical protein Tco_0607664 [Tanacetum coccineum]